MLYDAAGDDTGREFVELHAQGPADCPLAGARLEAGDGSGAGRWTLRWTGAAADTVRAGERFVIGGALVEPRPEAIVTLDLQNGPDAVRLVWPDGASEVVGWGAHEFAEYSCGAPAADVPSGQSLARVPDDADAGANALDFRAATPSPGRANRASRNAALARGTLRAVPERADPGAPLALSALVTNAGRDTLPPGAIAARAEAWPLAPAPGIPIALGGVTLGAALAPRESAAVAIEAAAPAAGKHRLVLRLALPGDEEPGDDADSLVVRSGPAPLALAEIQFHPAAGEGEWVEVRNESGAPLAIPDFRLADANGSPGTPLGGGGPLPPDSLAVLAQSRTALLARFPRLDTARVWEVHPWSSLNNSGGANGITDAVILREADGTPCERHEYVSAGIPAGATIEWRDGGWWPSREAGGSPLAPPRALEIPAGRFALSPERLAAGARSVRLQWSLPWPRAHVRFDLLDLAGRKAGTVTGEFLTPSAGERTVLLADVPPGLYAIAMRARAEGGADEITELRPLRIVRGGP